MIVFSNALHAFSLRLEKYFKDILIFETKLHVRKTRFEYQGFLYPIHVVTFESDTKLGFFDPETYQIGINKNLIYETKAKTLKDILRHEIAHYLCFLEYKEDGLNHGENFKKTCEKYGFNSEVSKASMNPSLEYQKLEGDLEAEKIYQKIKNLLKLASSSNPHEASLATLKANQLLLKYNLSHADYFEQDSALFYVHRILSQKKKSAKLSAIYDIIKHFMVRPVLRYTKNEVCLEITGTKTNIDLSDYVATFLDREFEVLWKKEQINSPHLKGLKNKNAFFYGIAKGYDEKMQNIKHEIGPDTRALVVLEKKLDEKVKLFYRRLASSSSQNINRGEAFNLGNKAGKNLNINKAIHSNSKTLLLN